MPLEIRDRLDLPVVVEDEVGLLQVHGRLPRGVGDEDLDELQGHRDLVLDRRLLGPRPRLSGKARPDGARAKAHEKDRQDGESEASHAEPLSLIIMTPAPRLCK